MRRRNVTAFGNVQLSGLLTNAAMRYPAHRCNDESEGMEDNRNTGVVLGGYGLIGAACVRELRQVGFDVVGVGRSKATAWRVLRDIEWRILDLAQASVDDLKRAVGGAHVIVNAAGALQDGLKDDVAAIHESMITRLAIALHGGATRVIQISAAGVRFDSSTEFFRSKARGDALLMASELDWVLLRPTLVLAREAYGGTSLLRASAAMPFTGFDVFPDSRERQSCRCAREDRPAIAAALHRDHGAG